MKQILIVLSFLIVSGSTKAQKLFKETINIFDSISLKKFCDKSDLCAKIIFLKKYRTAVCLKKGYLDIVLSSVSRETKKDFFFPIATGGIILPLKIRVSNFNDDINLLLNEFCSSSNLNVRF